MQDRDIGFSHRERRIALLAVIAAAVLAVAGIGLDRLMGPSLGYYGQQAMAATASGVLEAHPAA